MVRRSIVVENWHNNLPFSFWDGDVLHQVDTYIDSWQEMGNWWDGERNRKMLRVYTNRHQVFDLEGSENNWGIYKIWD
ncbi:hypothetical protein [Alicyclobacillus sp. SO9]|uniref:hypothetical protein n=1 Tax=Alicyclobacillus sp. SO9 TaxID=2665646 RepID=UPI0018E758FB|nr:hypothetical protein [Alicyclobacillus sp. SO9]